MSDLSDLAVFFAPKSIAVIGASNDPTKIGGRAIKNLTLGGYQGRILPINPKYGRVHGLVVLNVVAALKSQRRVMGRTGIALLFLPLAIQVVGRSSIDVPPHSRRVSTSLCRELLAARCHNQRLASP